MTARVGQPILDSVAGLAVAAKGKMRRPTRVAVFGFLAGVGIAVGLLSTASFLYAPDMLPVLKWLVTSASPVLWPTSGIIPGGHPTRAETVLWVMAAVISNGFVYALIISGITLGMRMKRVSKGKQEDTRTD